MVDSKMKKVSDSLQIGCFLGSFYDLLTSSFARVCHRLARVKARLSQSRGRACRLQKNHRNHARQESKMTVTQCDLMDDEQPTKTPRSISIFHLHYYYLDKYTTASVVFIHCVVRSSTPLLTATLGYSFLVFISQTALRYRFQSRRTDYYSLRTRSQYPPIASTGITQ